MEQSATEQKPKNGKVIVHVNQLDISINTPPDGNENKEFG